MSKIFTLLFVFVSSGLLAQNWDMVAEDVDYKIEQTHITCKTTQGYDYDYVIMRYTNLSNEELELSFNFERWYNDDFCQGCVNGDYSAIRVVTIPANGAIVGDCSSSEDYLKIFDHSLTNQPNVWRSKLTDLVINKIESKKN